MLLIVSAAFFQTIVSSDWFTVVGVISQTFIWKVDLDISSSGVAQSAAKTEAELKERKKIRSMLEISKRMFLNIVRIAQKVKVFLEKF